MDINKKHQYRSSQSKYSVSKRLWVKIWMKLASLNLLNRFATKMASFFSPPHKAGAQIARYNKIGFISPTSIIYHSNLWLGKHVYIAENVTIFEKWKKGKKIELGDNVHIYKDSILETGYEGELIVDSGTSIHPRCQINAFVNSIRIGKGVMIAPNCALYSYDHTFLPDKPISEQALKSKGPIIINDEAWLGYGVVVLSGVTIGKGAVIGAGSVVSKDIPDGAIAVGNPAQVIKMRSELTN